MKKFYNISDGFSDHDLFITFSGPMSHDLLVEMGEILKIKMKLEGASFSTILKVFSILVELIQNISHYSRERFHILKDDGTKATTGCGIIAIGRKEEHYFLLSGNIIKLAEIEPLQGKLTRLNQMDSRELKIHYQKHRKMEPEKSSKGAGLGFIEIARKISRPLDFEFSNIDEQESFFSLKTVI
ncbi:MAG: hypothetical protein HQ517_09565 [SAR324 cluster bacterium]|nr:hypothetical protein [SAR324 cluster bacterium]